MKIIQLEFVDSSRPNFCGMVEQKGGGEGDTGRKKGI